MSEQNTGKKSGYFIIKSVLILEEIWPDRKRSFSNLLVSELLVFSLLHPDKRIVAIVSMEINAALYLIFEWIMLLHILYYYIHLSNANVSILKFLQKYDEKKHIAYLLDICRRNGNVAGEKQSDKV